jgi:hypothetical protein
VLLAGQQHLEQIQNNSHHKVTAFAGQWKHEVGRILGNPLLPACTHLTVFGDEATNYDEAKRFCYDPTIYGYPANSTSSSTNSSVSLHTSARATPTFFGNKNSKPAEKSVGSSKCLVYSIGSNDKWDFEEHMYKSTQCDIETFDCTLHATVPAHIRDRTHFHHVCLGAVSAKRMVKQAHGGRELEVEFLTLADINGKLMKRENGPDFLKIDIEVS